MDFPLNVSIFIWSIFSGFFCSLDDPGFIGTDLLAFLVHSSKSSKSIWTESPEKKPLSVSTTNFFVGGDWRWVVVSVSTVFMIVGRIT